MSASAKPPFSLTGTVSALDLQSIAERIEPLKAGADETWLAMMPDLSWKEAQAMTAHMGRF